MIVQSWTDMHQKQAIYFVIWKGKVSTLLRQSKGKGCMRLPELSLFSCLHRCSRNCTCCHIQSSNHINEISYHSCKVRYIPANDSEGASCTQGSAECCTASSRMEVEAHCNTTDKPHITRSHLHQCLCGPDPPKHPIHTLRK